MDARKEPLYVDVNRAYADEIWSKDQQRAMAAIADAVIAPLSPDDKKQFLDSLPTDLPAEQREKLVAYADMKFSDLPNGVNLIAMHVVETVSFKLRMLFSLVLSALSTKAGCLPITGHIGPVWELSPEAIQGFLRLWRNTPVEVLRTGELGLRGLTLVVFYRHMDAACEAMGYPTGPATDWQDPPGREHQTPVEHYAYRFLNEQLPAQPTSSPIVLNTDVVIVGSGCGGGVAAGYLAERGVKVMVVDKGIYVRPEDMNGRQDFGLEQMFERLGFVPTTTSSIAVLAGSGFGGGSTINWSAMLTPRHFLREAWAHKYGVPYYRSAQFTQDLDACLERTGTTSDIEHNVANSLLVLGALRSGQPVNAVPQNNGHLPHYCGKCNFGCASGHKQSTVATYLADAAKHGAEFLLRYDVERVLMDRGRATGVVGKVGEQQVVVHAKHAVVVAGGSVNTPAILLRTPELKANRQIGENLHLHPVAIVHGFYNFPVKPWEGPILTTVSNAAEMVNPHGWGAKIEVMVSAPSLFCALTPYENSLAHKKLLARYRNAFSIIVLVRDRDGGRVRLDKYGRALMEYELSKFDEKSMLEGVLRATEIHMSAGAAAIATSQPLAPFECPPPKTPTSGQLERLLPGCRPFETAPPQGDINDPRFLAYQKQIAKKGFSMINATIGSAHQMSSCRMGANPRTSACDPRGKVRGAERLYVADASALPEATGVNPMLTILATARGIARNIATDLGVARADDAAAAPLPAHL